MMVPPLKEQRAGCGYRVHMMQSEYMDRRNAITVGARTRSGTEAK